MTSSNKTTLVCSLALILVPTSACDQLWPLDHPDDPRQCNPRCAAGTRCHLGQCRAPDAALPDAPPPDAEPPCGNTKLDPQEVCDKGKLGNKTCKSFGFDEGELRCASDCKAYDTALCHGCHKDGLGRWWCALPAGTFSMGSPTSEPCREQGGVKETQHQVTLTRPFEIMQAELTQRFYGTFPPQDPSHFATCGLDCPVDSVTWHEAAARCNDLSTDVGKPKCYNCQIQPPGNEMVCTILYAGKKIYECKGYRLPTEAEWEYAYRGATTSAYHSGANDKTYCKEDQKTEANLHGIAWYKANAADTTHPASKKTPNGWKLHDMAGNVREWCHDWFQLDLGSAAVTDPVSQGTTIDHVVRGCSWDDLPGSCRAAARHTLTSTVRDTRMGFRCVRTRDPRQNPTGP